MNKSKIFDLNELVKEYNKQDYYSLLKELRDFDKSDINGNTVFMMASKYNQKEIVNYLIKSDNIDISKTNNMGYNALMYASEYGNKDIVSTLLKTKVNNMKAGINIKSNKGGYNALMLSVKKSNYNTTKTILDHVVKYDYLLDYINDTDYNGNTSLNIATINEDFDMIKLLLKYKASINIKNKYGFNPLMIASCKKNEDLFRYFVKQGANTNFESDFYNFLISLIKDDKKYIVGFILNVLDKI